jgi:RHS repeat-associated protein
LKKTGTKDSSTQYINDGMFAAVERTGSGAFRCKYVYVNGMALARIDSAGNTYIYFHDALGSIVGMGSTANGAVYKSYLYSDFGDSLGEWGSAPYNTLKYTGQERDRYPLNAYNLRAREYYPTWGRFMQNDPIGDKGGGLNWYSYVKNNPVNKTDITGKDWWRYGHYCGEGQDPGKPTPVDELDAACSIHDDCYKRAGLSGPRGAFSSNITEQQKCDRKECDKALCTAAMNYNWPINCEAGVARDLVIIIFCR